MKLSADTPAYNKEVSIPQNIETLISKSGSRDFLYEVIIIYDNLKDKILKVKEELSKQNLDHIIKIGIGNMEFKIFWNKGLKI